MSRFIYESDDQLDLVTEDMLAGMGITPIEASSPRTDATIGGGGHAIGQKFDPNKHKRGHGGKFADMGGRQKPVGAGAAPGAAKPKAAKQPKAKTAGEAKPKVTKAKATGTKTATPKPAGTAKATKPAKAAGPKYTKFDGSEHKAKISAHKNTEAFHRTESLKIADKQRALREQAKALPKSDKAGRAELKSQHQALAKQREEHRSKATESMAARIAESKAMQDARRQHVANHVAAKQAHVAGTDGNGATKAVSASKAKAPDQPKETKAKTAETKKEKPSKPPPATEVKGAPMSDRSLVLARDHVLDVANSKELDAAELYSGHTYGKINNLLRTGKSGHPAFADKPDNEIHDAIKQIDSLMGKCRTPADIITYRATAPHPSFVDLKPGEHFVDKAFMSTTTDINFMKSGQFDDSYQFHITSPRGTKIAGIPSEYPEEKEMLLARSSALRLDRREVVDGKHIMYFTVVGQE